MGKKYLQEVADFIAANMYGKTAKELVEMTNTHFGTNITESAMKSYKCNHNLKSGTPNGIKKGTPSRVFPAHIRDYILNNYNGVGPTKMTGLLNSTFGTNYSVPQVNGYYSNHKLNSGISGYFEKGGTPVNKGIRGVCAPGCEKSWFKHGDLPANTKPLGYERITKDGYIEVKIAIRPSRPDCNDNFVAKHRLVWEEANGPIPPGHVLIFRDSVKTNCKLSNLRMVTLAENCELNRRNLRSNNPDFTDTGILIAKVNTIAARRKKPKRFIVTKPTHEVVEVQRK